MISARERTDDVHALAERLRRRRVVFLGSYSFSVHVSRKGHIAEFRQFHRAPLDEFSQAPLAMRNQNAGTRSLMASS